MLPTSHPSGHGLLLGNFMGEANRSVPQPSASGCRAALTSQFAKQMSCPPVQPCSSTCPQDHQRATTGHLGATASLHQDRQSKTERKGTLQKARKPHCRSKNSSISCRNLGQRGGGH